MGLRSGSLLSYHRHHKSTHPFPTYHIGRVPLFKSCTLGSLFNYFYTILYFASHPPSIVFPAPPPTILICPRLRQSGRRGRVLRGSRRMMWSRRGDSRWWTILICPRLRQSGRRGRVLRGSRRMLWSRLGDSRRWMIRIRRSLPTILSRRDRRRLPKAPIVRDAESVVPTPAN